MTAYHILQKALMITAFVAVMMIAIEYVNVRTRGRLIGKFEAHPFKQYLLAVILGATPGCLGAFTLVALYIHRRITLGAVVAGMIATSGDEIFVMLALFPGTALLLTGGLALLGLAAGWATDSFARLKPSDSGRECVFDIHGGEPIHGFSRAAVLKQWKSPSAHRAVLAAGTGLFLLALTAGDLGTDVWNWIRVTLVAIAAFGLFIVVTMDDHFLDEHLWRHVICKHVPRIFLWTLGALAAIAVVEHFLNLEALVAENRWLVLLAAALVGLIPESGPHLIFVTLFAAGTVPLSILAASSAVQDGHGMLPLLAHSRRDFLKVKAVNFFFGLGMGIVLMALGW